MCDDCIPVELPPTGWALIACLIEDFALGAIMDAPPTSPERLALRASIAHYTVHELGQGITREELAMILARYAEQIERRCGFGDFADMGPRPIPNMVRTIGSTDN